MAKKKTETKKATAQKKTELEKSKDTARLSANKANAAGEEVTAKSNKETSKVRYNTLVLQEQGARYKTLFTKKYKNRKKWEEPDFRKIRSLIPGTVIKVYVEEGQKVKEGDLMMVLEAMKMKNRIYFSMDGIVKKIHVSENERVPKDHIMIELK